MSKASFSKKEMNQLRSLLQNTHVSAPPKKKKKNRRRAAAPSRNLPGTRIQYSERIGSVVVKNGFAEASFSYKFYPGCVKDNKAVFPILNRFGKIFESYKIHSISLEWAASSGTNTDGMIALAVDSGISSKVSSFDDVVQFRPSISFPVWTSSRTLNVPTTMTQPSLLRYNDNTQPNVPFSIVAAVRVPSKTSADTSFGMVSVKWDISFVGISPTT